MAISNREKKAVGVYVHIPFCRKKCYYCDFYSLPDIEASLIDEYCQAVAAEIKMAAGAMDDLFVSTIFLGGGTPSLLSAGQVDTILQQIKASFTVSSDVEITMEANPATIDLPEFEQYLTAGVNRISLGVQSFHDEELQILGRIHKAKDIFDAVEIFHRYGFKNFNLDLIYAIPGQSNKSWETNLHKAIEMEPAHISAYLLQLDPETVMGKRAAAKLLVLADEDTEAEMYDRTVEILTEANFRQYEISNFSVPGYECRHNLSYWRSINYLGFGAGAVSFVNTRRLINVPNVLQYINRIKSGKQPIIKELENMSPRERLADAMVLGLRLVEGINIEEINKRFDADILEEYNQAIQENIKKGLLILKNGQLSLTRKGYFISNQVLCHFIA